MPDPTPAKHEPPKELPQQAQTQKFQGREKRTPADQAEYFYNLKWMHIIFFISSLLMLYSFIHAMYQDWDQSWKNYQRAYQAIELARIESEVLKANALKHAHEAQVQKLQGDKTRLEKEIAENAELRKLKAELDALGGEHAYKMQVMNFKKSDYMTFRFRFESAKHHLDHAIHEQSPRLPVYEEHFRHESRIFDDIRAQMTKAKAEFDAVDARKARLDDAVTLLQKPLEEVNERIKALNKEIAEGMRRIKREMPQIWNTIRDAPGLDFFEPTVKIRQLILTDIQQEMHFSKVERVDRCHTCHEGIANPLYAAVHDKGADGQETAAFVDPTLRAFVDHAAGRGEPADCAVCRQAEYTLEAEDGTKMATHVVVKHGGWGSDKADQMTRALAAHPRLDLYVGGASPHPMARFGCTSCHEGDGRDTEFSRVVHFPNDEEQKKVWERRHGYHYRELWDEPMKPKKHVYSSCRKCHTGQVDLADGGDYVQGMKLYEKLGCYACHRTDTYQVLPKDQKDARERGEANRIYRRPGPPLTHIADKVDENWMFKWVMAPKEFRHTTRMPHFFGQTNSRKVAVGEREWSPTQVEQTIVQSLTAYLMSTSESRKYAAPPKTASPPDVQRGRLLFEQVGCRACHDTTPNASIAGRKDLRNADDRYRAAEGTSHYQSEFGPNLSAMGSKTNRVWLYEWLRDPKHYFPQTRMGNFRLSEQEAMDVVEYLMSLKDAKFEATPGMPKEVDTELLNELIYEQLRAKLPDVDAKAERDAMAPENKVLWFGRRMVQNYGCYSCHALSDETHESRDKSDFGWTDRSGTAHVLKGTGRLDWLNMEGIGVELTGAQPWGVKGVDRLAYNFAEYEPPNHLGVSFHHPITGEPYTQVGTEKPTNVIRVHRTRHDFLFHKLLNPRVYDGGKELSTPPDELLRMPNFYLTPEETKVLSTFVLSFLDAEVGGLIERIKKRPSPDEIAMARGERLLRESNCRGCHRLELDKFKVEWRRKEKDAAGKEKDVVTNPWIEGRLKLELKAEEVKEQLKRWKLPEREGSRILVLDWCSDGCSMEMVRPVNPASPYVYYDGHAWWLLDATYDGAVTRDKMFPVLVRRPQEGGDILPQVVAFKKSIADEYWYTGDAGAQESRFPPHLRTQGVKTQSEWLFAFLKSPTPIRPNLNVVPPDYREIPMPPADVRAKIKAEVAKLADAEADDDEVLAELKKMGKAALPAIREEFLAATSAVTRWRLMTLMDLRGHPDVSLRMPTFGFDDEEATSIAKYFWVRDQLRGKDVYPHTFMAERDADRLSKRTAILAEVNRDIVATTKACQACHWYDGKPAPGDAQASNKFAPDFAIMEDRLRPRWLEAWLKKPSVVYPGTTMTEFQFPSDDHRTAVIELLMNFRKLKHLK